METHFLNVRGKIADLMTICLNTEDSSLKNNNINVFFPVLILLMLLAATLSACANIDIAPSESGKNENMVTEYMASSVDIPTNIGSAISFCVSDEYVYILGDGSGENTIARYSQNNSTWESSSMYTEYTPVNISYYDKLWMLLRDEKGSYFLCSAEDEEVSGPIQVNISGEVRLTGFYAYSEGLLLWNYSGIYICDYASGRIIREKQLNDTWTLNEISVAQNGIYAQINKNGEIGLISIEDIFSNTSEFIRFDCSSACVPLCVGCNDSCLIGELNDLKAYDMSSGTYNKLFSWADIGCLMPDIVPAVIENADKTIFILDRYTGDLVQISPQLVPQKTTITLATSINNSSLNYSVYEFNRSNSSYKIEVEMYSINDVDRLRTEIIAGKGPDIIDTFSLPLAGETCGYYEDLLPYLEGDPEISESDFIPNILEASKINGALYYVMPSFNLKTVVSLGEKRSEGCSFDEYKSQFADVANCEIDIGMSTEDILKFAFPIIQQDIIVPTGKNKTADMELLKQWLVFCSEAAAFDISFETISNCRRVSALPENLGGEISFIGLPGQTNCGSYAVPGNMCFAMLSTCSHKDAAWSFLRRFFLPAYQNNIAPFGFPIILNSLDTVILEAINDDDTEFSEEDAEKLRELVDSIDVVSYFDNTLRDMVAADVNAYYSGQRSLTDVISVVEPKINIYLSEQN